jgi:hypothetical protein
LLSIFETPHKQKKKTEKKEKTEKIQKIKKIFKEKNISEKNILEHPGNCQKLVEEDQNIQN